MHKYSSLISPCKGRWKENKEIIFTQKDCSQTKENIRISFIIVT